MSWRAIRETCCAVYGKWRIFVMSFYMPAGWLCLPDNSIYNYQLPNIVCRMPVVCLPDDCCIHTCVCQVCFHECKRIYNWIPYLYISLHWLTCDYLQDVWSLSDLPACDWAECIVPRPLPDPCSLFPRWPLFITRLCHLWRSVAGCYRNCKARFLYSSF